MGVCLRVSGEGPLGGRKEVVIYPCSDVRVERGWATSLSQSGERVSVSQEGTKGSPTGSPWLKVRPRVRGVVGVVPT